MRQQARRLSFKAIKYFLTPAIVTTGMFMQSAKSENQLTDLQKCLEKCLQENQSCMIHITTLTNKIVNRDWLSKYAPVEFNKELNSRASEVHSLNKNSAEWKLESKGEKTLLEAIGERLERSTKPITTSNEDWLSHCNQVLNNCNETCQKVHGQKK